MIILFGLEKKSLNWLAVAFFIIEPLNPGQHFELVIELKLN